MLSSHIDHPMCQTTQEGAHKNNLNESISGAEITIHGVVKRTKHREVIPLWRHPQNYCTDILGTRMLAGL